MKRLLTIALLVTACAPIKPAATVRPTVPPAAAPPLAAATPEPTIARARFQDKAGLIFPASVTLGETFSVSVSVQNVGPRGVPWLTITGLTDAAPLIGCKPKCIDHGGSFGVDVLQFSRLDEGRSATYTMRFQAQHVGKIDWVMTASGVDGGLPYPAGDVYWSATTTILLG